MYYGIAPIVLLKVKLYTVLPYGDPSLKKPFVYVRDNPYQLFESTMFSLYQNSYDFAGRVALGDMDQSEASNYFLKFGLIRSSLNITSVEF